jgi:hypothetical protein
MEKESQSAQELYAKLQADQKNERTPVIIAALGSFSF